MILLSIDPGKTYVGAAIWNNRELVAAHRVASSDNVTPGVLAHLVKAWFYSFTYGEELDTLVVEFPQTYGGRSSRGDTNDLFPLAAVDGALEAVFPNAIVHYVRPHEWKGSVQKPKSVKTSYAIEDRVRARLTAAEAACVRWPTNQRAAWDVADAIGLGLYKVGRFERVRVYARE